MHWVYKFDCAANINIIQTQPTNVDKYLVATNELTKIRANYLLLSVLYNSLMDEKAKL